MTEYIVIKEARQHNLKGFDLKIPLRSITVITGVSGSGKSSLAFDTLYAKGQRRYVETFSPYARQFMDRMDKPNVREIEGILPAIAINTVNPIKSARSTLGTITEIADYMKLLFSKVATLYCKKCKRQIRKDSPQSIYENLQSVVFSKEIIITFPLDIQQKFNLEDIETVLRQQGFFRIFYNQAIQELSPKLLASLIGQSVDVVIDKVRVIAENKKRLIDSIEMALRFGKGRVNIYADKNQIPFSSFFHCPYCNITYQPPSANLFSFNSPLGACDTCRGFGKIIGVDLDTVIPDPINTSLVYLKVCLTILQLSVRGQ